jgi:copper chaperone NosL
MDNMRKIQRLFRPVLVVIFFEGCSGNRVKPVDIFSEDVCSSCRMAITEKRFAAELITENHEVFKFDDIGCLNRFRNSRPDVLPVAEFYVDYHKEHWLSVRSAVLVRTGLATPMGSGLVAFGDSLTALSLQREYPAKE